MPDFFPLVISHPIKNLNSMTVNHKLKSILGAIVSCFVFFKCVKMSQEHTEIWLLFSTIHKNAEGSKGISIRSKYGKDFHMNSQRISTRKRQTAQPHFNILIDILRYIYEAKRTPLDF